MLSFKNMMKQIKSIGFLILFSGCSLQAIGQNSSLGIIKVKNESQANRNELISIPYDQIAAKLPSGKVTSFKLVDSLTNEEVPYQIETKGTGKPQNLLAQVQVAAGTALSLAIKEGKPTEIKAKTFARYVPERYDDFAWENDKVAFRMYGHALATRKDNAMGIDVWSKRTSELIIDKWYKRGEYHSDHGEGMDYYSVGNTLGGGDIAPYVHDQIVFTNNYKSWKVLDNGPLRSTFELTYEEKNAGDILFTTVKRISMDAGSQLYRVEATFNYDGSDELPVVVGIVKRENGDSVLLNMTSGVLGYWEPEAPNYGITGVGCVFVSDVNDMKIDKGHFLALGKVKSQQPYVYYSGAAWNKAGIITSSKQWFNYLLEFSTKLKNPLIVIVK